MSDKQTANDGRFKKGNKKAGSRKGVPNKMTATVKEMILKALDKAGGVDYLFEQAHANPTAFMTLLGKVLPTQVVGDENAPLSIQTIERVIIETKTTDS